MTTYVFHPRSFVTAQIHAEWNLLYEQMQQTRGPKHLKLWCAIPPGSWHMADVSIAGPFAFVKVCL